MRSATILLTSALEYAARGWPVMPLHTPTFEPNGPCSCGRPDCATPGKHPRISEWTTRATTDEAQIREWWARWPEANVGILTGLRSDLLVVDVDGERGVESLKRLMDKHGKLPRGPRQVTGNNGYHLLFHHAPGLKNAVGFADGLDIRTDGGLIVAEPSVHPNGREYLFDPNAHPADLPLVDAPEWLLERIKEAGRRDAALPEAGQPIREGGRNDTLFRLGCSMRGKGLGERAIRAALLTENEDRCDPPLLESEVADIAGKIAKYEQGDVPRDGSYAPDPFVASVAFVAGRPEYDTPPKEPAPEAFYGIAGDVVRAFEPHTESAPVALLVSFLVMIGNVIGRNPHFWIEGARHGTNLFAVLVGPSGNARKGTATRRVDELIHSINCNWTKNIARGLSSGEGLIHHVRDARIEQVPVKKSGRFTGEYDEVVVDQGVEDKRAMIREEEFASVLKVAGREGNTLSVRIREAWDNVRMGSLTKGSKETATDPHISILGHITDVELRRYLTATEGANGFANRFLWVCTHRSKFLPRGGGRPNLAPLTWKIHEAVELAQKMEGLDFDEEAGAVWDAIYAGLTTRPGGMFGSITSRADPQVLRLSVLYAALDGFAEINLSHLFAALAVWDFCEASARHVFGSATGDEVADTIEEMLVEAHPGFLTRTEIRDRFGRHAPPGRIPKALSLLRESGRAKVQLLETGGRPTECWTAILRTDRDKSDKSDKSHLERAKEAATKAT